MAGRIRVGIGGWTYAPWRGSFYPDGLPQKRELDYASRHLTTIEVNGTYYRSQTPRTFAGWHDETPEDFVFALKAPRFATNRKVLAEAGESIQRFIDSGIAELKDKLGPIYWQFMATKKFDPEDFAGFLALLPKEVEGRALRHAVELRHESFLVPECAELLHRHGVAAVIAGDSEFPQFPDVTADFVYARIMGTTETPKAGYSSGDLTRWSEAAVSWAKGGDGGLPPIGKAAPKNPRDVFLYVISGHKAANPAAAMALIEQLPDQA